MNRWVLMLGLLVPWLAGAEEDVLSARPRGLGGVLSPAALPGGSTSLWAQMGAPELAVGFRQGISGVEIGGEARMDWERLGLVLEGIGRMKVWGTDRLALAPTLGLGVTLNSGARYLDPESFAAVMLRVEQGVVASYELLETVALVGQLRAPWDVGLSPGGSWRWQGLVGAGAEVYLGDNLWLLGLGELGLDVAKPADAERHTRLGWGVRLGVGVRLF